MNNLMLKKTLNMSLKLQEHIKHIGFTFDKIKPSEPTISINKTNIIIMTLVEKHLIVPVRKGL